MTTAHLSLVLWDAAYGRHSIGLKLVTPHKFFEAVGHGIPVLCSPHDSIREWLSEYRVGEMADHVTAETLARAARRMLADQETYDAYQRQCHKAFAEKWNFQEQIAPVLGMLKSEPSSLGRE